MTFVTKVFAFFSRNPAAVTLLVELVKFTFKLVKLLADKDITGPEKKRLVEAAVKRFIRELVASLPWLQQLPDEKKNAITEGDTVELLYQATKAEAEGKATSRQIKRAARKASRDLRKVPLTFTPGVY